MRLLFYLILVFKVCFVASSESAYYSVNSTLAWPTVGVSILVRNRAHSLPYFLSCLHRLSYPKMRMYLWIWSDHNSDQSDDIITHWMGLHKDEYNEVYFFTNSSEVYYPDETNVPKWTEARFQNVINIREKALMFARKRWADYHFMLDADVYLTNKNILASLVEKDLTVVAPMLKSGGVYSNFWAAMSESGYYKRAKIYTEILESTITGCFPVPMVHTAVLINLNHRNADHLAYDPGRISNYDGPFDDIIIFAKSAEMNGVPLHICNDNWAGYVPLPSGDFDKQEPEHLIDIRILALQENNEIPLDDELKHFVRNPKPSKFNLDEIYMINLERRHMRREFMERNFEILGMNVNIKKAVDGTKLDMSDFPRNIQLLPGFEDPYHKRPMKAGEVGCFLSHYEIWEEVKRRHDVVLVLEDDVNFHANFRGDLLNLLDEIRTMDWDLVYIGRKVLSESSETRVTKHTVRPLYSYWTIGYLLSKSGAKKLIDAQPLTKLLPVDEFLPIMFDQHPNDIWKNAFPNRNLIALSASPLLIEPMHYVNEPGYVSDTEDSNIVYDDALGQDKPMTEDVDVSTA